MQHLTSSCTSQLIVAFLILSITILPSSSLAHLANEFSCSFCLIFSVYESTIRAYCCQRALLFLLVHLQFFLSGQLHSSFHIHLPFPLTTFLQQSFPLCSLYNIPSLFPSRSYSHLCNSTKHAFYFSHYSNFTDFCDSF